MEICYRYICWVNLIEWKINFYYKNESRLHKNLMNIKVIHYSVCVWYNHKSIFISFIDCQF